MSHEAAIALNLLPALQLNMYTTGNTRSNLNASHTEAGGGHEERPAKLTVAALNIEL
jgi:hypothetical protein